MKKVVFILSALLFITGCKVTSTSSFTPEEYDEYSDGIYLFVAYIKTDSRVDFSEIQIDCVYEEDSSELKESYYINPKETKVSEVFKVDTSKLKVINFLFKHRGQNTLYHSSLGNLNKSSFSNSENGLYVAEFFWEGFSDVYLRKTKSPEYYQNNETFFDNKSVLFIKGNYSEDFSYDIVYQKINKSTNSIFKLYGQDLKSIILYNPPRSKHVAVNGNTYSLDCSKLCFFSDNDKVLDLTQFEDGYFYTEIDSDGNFTTPVKLNSYKDILE